MGRTSGNKSLWLAVITLLLTFFMVATFVYAYPTNSSDTSTPSAIRYLKLDTDPGLSINAPDVFLIGRQYTVHVAGRLSPLKLTASNNNLSLNRTSSFSWGIQPLQVGFCTLTLSDSQGHTLSKNVEIRRPLSR